MGRTSAQCGALGPKIDEDPDDVTVYVHDSVSGGGDGDPARTRYSTDALVDYLTPGNYMSPRSPARLGEHGMYRQ
jgi:hypothetical protein